MALQIDGQTIARVKVVDDDQAAREAMTFTVTDADLQAAPDEGPLPQLTDFVKQVRETMDAVVCDHRMRGPYAPFDGAEAVADLVKKKFPAVLCTRWSTADIDAMRQYIRYIPALVPSDDASPDAIVDGISRCIQEFNNTPVPSRKPWRTMLRVESVATDLRPSLFYVTIRGWSSR